MNTSSVVRAQIISIFHIVVFSSYDDYTASMDVAIDEIRRRELLPGYHINFHVRKSECNPKIGKSVFLDFDRTVSLCTHKTYFIKFLNAPQEGLEGGTNKSHWFTSVTCHFFLNIYPTKGSNSFHPICFIQ